MTMCPPRRIPVAKTKRVGLLALCLSLLGLALPASGAPLGEELTDFDGFLGWRPGAPFQEGAWPSRLGPPLDQVEFQEPTHLRHYFWGLRVADWEDSGTTAKGLVLQVRPDGKGGWVVHALFVGKAFQVAPLVHGHALDRPGPLLQSLRGHLEQGAQVFSQEEGLSLGPEDTPDPTQPAAPGWSVASLFAKRLPGLLARTTKLQQAIAQGPWPLGGQHLALHRVMLEEGGEGPLVLVPAKVLSTKASPQEEMDQEIRLHLARHVWAQATRGEIQGGLRPLGLLSQEWTIQEPSRGTAGRLRPGDRVVLQAHWVGPEADAPAALRAWRVENLSLLMAYPGGTPLPYPQLWRGLPEP